MCDGMCTMCPAAGINVSSVSAAFSARSGVLVDSMRWMYMCRAPGCFGCARITCSVRATISAVPSCGRPSGIQ